MDEKKDTVKNIVLRILHKYSELLRGEKFDEMKALKELTGMTPPDDVVQLKYTEYVSYGRLDYLPELG